MDPANKADSRAFFRSIAALEALDDATLQIRLQELSADLLMVLASSAQDSWRPPQRR